MHLLPLLLLPSRDQFEFLFIFTIEEERLSRREREEEGSREKRECGWGNGARKNILAIPSHLRLAHLMPLLLFPLSVFGITYFSVSPPQPA
jgi:hypothetical protein